MLYDTFVAGQRNTQGFEIHGSAGAPLPEKDHRWQKKIEYLKENPQKKGKGMKGGLRLRMLILVFNMAKTKELQEALDPRQWLGL